MNEKRRRRKKRHNIINEDFCSSQVIWTLKYVFNLWALVLYSYNDVINEMHLNAE